MGPISCSWGLSLQENPSLIIIVHVDINDFEDAQDASTQSKRKWCVWLEEASQNFSQ